MFVRCNKFGTYIRQYDSDHHELKIDIQGVQKDVMRTILCATTGNQELPGNEAGSKVILLKLIQRSET